MTQQEYQDILWDELNGLAGYPSVAQCQAAIDRVSKLDYSGPFENEGEGLLVALHAAEEREANGS